MDVAGAFGQLVKLRRGAVGMSQAALADKAGLHRTEISLIERGKRNVGIETLSALARAFDMTPANLLLDLDVSKLELRRSR
jgi:transcriptional regulator with XRE-family HTH domain